MAHAVGRWRYRIGADGNNRHIAHCTVLAAIDPKSSRHRIAFAAERILYGRANLHGIVAACPAAIFTGTSGVTAQFLPHEADREQLLESLRIRDVQPAQAVQSTLLRKAVPAVDSTATRRPEPVIHDEGIAVLTDTRGDGERVLAPPRACVRCIRFGQGTPNGVDDFAGREDRRHGHWGGRQRIPDGAFRCDDGHVAISPFVARDRRIEERRQRHIDGGIGVGEGTVLKSLNLRVRPGEIDG